jgi:hypothetical protein
MTNLTAIYDTKYDGSGAEAAIRGQKEVSKSFQDTSDQAGRSGVNIEGMFKKLERPLSFLVFSQLSDQLTGIQAKGQTSGEVLSKIFHSVGMALTFVAPPLGIFTLGMVALWDIFEKYRNSGNKTADEIISMGNELQKGAEDAAKAADAMEKKYGADDREVQSLRKLSEENKKQHDDMVTHYEMLAKIADEEVLYAQHTDTMGKEVDGLHYKTDELSKALAHQAEVRKELIALENQGAEKKETPDKTDETIMAKKHELQMQAYVDNLKLSDATKQLKADESLLAMNEAAILSTNDPKELQFFEEKEEWLKKLIGLENEHVTTLQAGAASQITTLENLKNAFTGSFSSIVNSVAQGGKSMVQIMKSTLSTMVTDFTNAEAGQLVMDAGKNAFLNPGLALAELAEATAISAAGAALSSSIGGQSAASSSPAAASVPTISNNSSTTQTNNTSLNVNIMGAQVIDPSTSALILKGLNGIVQTNGFQIGATRVNGVAQAPGSL